MHRHGAHGHAHGAPASDASRLDPSARRRSDRRRLALTLALAASYMLAELIGGWLSGSLALLADAGHMLSDVAALVLALFALWIAQRPADARRTFGHTRAEILAALAQGAGLVVVAVLVVIEAVDRLRSPSDVEAPLMLMVAAGGLVVNLVGLLVLEGGRGHSMNVRGAWLHVLSDALGSTGAIAAGLAIWLWGVTWADPAASLAIAVLIVVSAWNLLRDAIDVLMEAVPAHLDVEEIRTALRDVDGIEEVHDLHVWTIGSGEVSLSAHAVSTHEDGAAEVLGRLHDVLLERFGIDHSTIQIEPPGFDETGAHADGVDCAPRARAASGSA
ncbi:MAG: cation diffusion facilitator family transporter [Myxococcota bacterium]